MKPIIKKKKEMAGKLKDNPFPKQFRRYSPQHEMDKTARDLKLLYKK